MGRAGGCLWQKSHSLWGGKARRVGEDRFPGAGNKKNITAEDAKDAKKTLITEKNDIVGGYFLGMDLLGS
jgi:hypothetical protein